MRQVYRSGSPAWLEGHRELRLRDVLGAPSAAGADQRLKDCEAKLGDYTQRVFHAVGGQ